MKYLLTTLIFFLSFQSVLVLYYRQFGGAENMGMYQMQFAFQPMVFLSLILTYGI